MTNHRSRSRRAAIWIGVPLTLCLITSPALAVEQTAARKVGRGLAALATGFLEVPGNVVKLTRERNAAYGFTLGLAIGVGKLVPRYSVGVWDFLTAPFPVPAGFEPLVQPEFPWGYFDDPPSRP